MFLRSHQRLKDGTPHTYWSLVETMRTPTGPRQRTLCYLGELNGSAQPRWLKTIEVFNQQGESRQLKLFPADVAPPQDDEVAQVLVERVRLERTRRFGECFLGLDLWRRLELERLLGCSWTGPVKMPMCPGRGWRHCWPSTGCARRAANWPSNSAGFPRGRLSAQL